MKNRIILICLICLIAVSKPAFAETAAPVKAGDTLVYEETKEDQSPGDSNAVVYSGYIGKQVPVKRTVREYEEKIEKVDSGLKYKTPLKVGMRLPDENGETPKDRNDNMYAYYVESQEDVWTPAGVFVGCFKVVYRTLPDTNTEWYCPGVGVVKSEYIHHGTLINSLVVLKQIKKR